MWWEKGWGALRERKESRKPQDSGFGDWLAPLTEIGNRSKSRTH